VLSLLQLSNDVVLFTDGATDLAPGDRQRLADRSVGVIERRIRRVTGVSDGLQIHFEDGTEIIRSALLASTTRHLASDLPRQLSCKLNGPSRVAVDANWQTSVPGVYAAGDIATASSFVAMAAASGAEAAMRLDGALTKADT
jgi:thioredoxin reductase